MRGWFDGAVEVGCHQHAEETEREHAQEKTPEQGTRERPLEHGINSFIEMGRPQAGDVTSFEYALFNDPSIGEGAVQTVEMKLRDSCNEI
jgi:hypothetical protein